MYAGTRLSKLPQRFSVRRFVADKSKEVEGFFACVEQKGGTTVASRSFQPHGRTIRGQILLTVVLSMVAQRITSRRLGGRDRLEFVLIPMSSSRPPTTNDNR